jgi:hypothetical protein
MALDLSIGRGDNAPSPMWTLPFDPTGSDIVVVITMPGGSLLTLTSDGGDLVFDVTTRSVTWLVTTAQSALLPPTSFYTLRRVVPGGEVRYYAQGRIFGVDGPVGPASAVVTGAGPQGAPGAAATDAQIAVAVAAYIAANPITPVPPPAGAAGVLDFSSSTNSGLLAALGA